MLIELRSGLRDQQHYLGELESLRGIAIVLVFLFHFYGITYGIEAGDFNLGMSFIAAGNTGVTLFFVLSGFLLSLPFLRCQQSGHNISLKDYYRARALRILPLYCFTVVVAVLISGKVYAGLKALFFAYLGFEIFPFSVVWWTLSTEVQFYLLLPAIMWLFTFRSKLPLLLALVIWLVLYTLAFHWQWYTDYPMLVTKSLFGRLPAFLVGIVCAILFLRGDLRSRLSPALAAGLFIVAVILLGLVLQHSLILGDAHAEFHWHIRHSLEAALWGGVLLLILHCRFTGIELFNNSALKIIGKLSYSLYLVHVPVLFYAIYPAKTWSTLSPGDYPLLWLTFTFAISLGLSFILYRCIELPFLIRKQKTPMTNPQEPSSV